MRDCDRSILQQLLSAHSSIQDIREQQKLALQEQQELDKRLSWGSAEDLDKFEEDTVSSDYFSRNNSKNLTPQETPHHLPTTKTNLEIHVDDTKDDDDELLRQFLGEDNVQRLNYFSKSRPTYTVNVEEDIDRVSSASSSRRSSEQDKSAGFTSNGKSMAELKVEAKREGRSSVAFEMQMLRQKLQEEAKEELAAFDLKFDTPSSLPTLLEEGKRPYRHSILNRMEELLNPPSHGKTHTGFTSHIRQSSEPVAMNNTVWNPLTQSNSTTKVTHGFIPSSQSTNFVSHSRKDSEPSHNSFRLPSSYSNYHTDKLTRTGSDGIHNSKEEIAAKFGVKSRQKQVHYDTTVVKRRSSSSSRNGTLEKKKHPLQYSVESLDNDKLGSSSSINDDRKVEKRDLDSPEHKTVLPHGRNGNGHFRPHPQNKIDSLPITYHQEKPKLTPLRSYQNPSSREPGPQSPDVYPEMSPSPPLNHLSPSTSKDTISPYMTTSQLRQEMDEYLSQGTNFVYRPYSEVKKKGFSSPFRRKQYIPSSGNDTWL